MNASGALRQRTRTAHDRLENTPVGQAMAHGRIGTTAYVEYLRATSIVVTALHTQVRRHGTEKEQALVEPMARWRELLAADLEALAPDPARTRTRAHEAALDAAAAIRRHVADGTAWLFGLAYVLHGSHRGNRAVAGPVQRALGLPGEAGVGYLRATEGDDKAFGRFQALLDRELTGRRDLDSACAGATETFAFFERILTALEDEDHDAPHVTAINPEAGNHPIVHDEACLKIALEVGDRSHQAFGYLVARYGERGRRYARSDGAWLPTLGNMPFERARRQTDWLARLLSARGVPSICLEVHLTELHLTLSGADTSVPANVDQLGRLARHVADRREQTLDAEVYERLRATALPSLDPRGAEVLLGAAIDQHSGLAPCADRLRDWLESAAGLGPVERATLLDFLEAARVACSP